MPPDEASARLSRIKANLMRRATILDSIRDFFHQEGFLEVETPLLVPSVAPEQYIAPFRAGDWFLSTSPELQMKRLLAAGYERIFQLCHCFRRHEQGKHHNPEFTMLEWYRAGADYLKIIEDTEQLVLYLARKLLPGTILGYQNKKIDLALPWYRITVREAFLKAAGWDPPRNFEAERFDVDLAEKVMPAFPAERPTVLMDYPAACASLARLKPGNEKVAERAEVFIGGLEIANAYSELNDAPEQKRRFQQEIEQLRLAGNCDFTLPARFLEAVTHLPPCGGIALGVDRLVMLFCDTASIEDVIAFPSAML